MEKLYYVMDETDTPYKDGEYTPTLEDDLSLLRIVERDGLELKPDSRLYKLREELRKNGTWK